MATGAAFAARSPVIVPVRRMVDAHAKCTINNHGASERLELCSYAPPWLDHPWLDQVGLPIGDDILIPNFVPRARVMTRKEFLQQEMTESMTTVARADSHEPPAAYCVPRVLEKNG